MKPLLIAVVSIVVATSAVGQVPIAARGVPASESLLEEMAPFIAPCVAPTSGSRVFTRCYDTHSSIHAHWAAYRLARLRPHLSALAVASRAALTPAKLRFEVRYMQYTYAAAWFLRLAIDYEKWARVNGVADPSRLRPVGDQMAHWLRTFYLTNPVNPYAVEYNNPAWAFAQLHAYYVYTNRPILTGLVSTAIRSAFLVRINSLDFRSDFGSTGFFSVIGNWYYVMATTQSPAVLRQFTQLQPRIPTSHLLVNRVSSVHSYGLVWSRMWAFRALARSAPNRFDRRRFRVAAERHVDAGLTRHHRYKGNFANYDHWVPQFAIYAATEGM